MSEIIKNVSEAIYNFPRQHPNTLKILIMRIFRRTCGKVIETQSQKENNIMILSFLSSQLLEEIEYIAAWYSVNN